ncbi:NAD(P)-binding protein [Xylona heveae TC161]|uniref:NAD(P)-binding protein n=1 Tax=Xylona heveae (strain CBS 132557 / TC161) TaxID=1328760 RepID=A0A165JA99_XYLHT|nr:NAD(P)-binding protein [Xylona heveae TC161]KZF25964.1 NAD(P)-binding protein [Xylona heveae TC161]
MATTDGAEKPTVLIIGGLGYIGRFLALHIHENNLASEVRLVDKVLPQLAWLGPEFKDACAQDKFMQADASREHSLSRVFDRPDGKQFDYVFNCGGETRYSQDDEVYRLRTYNLSVEIGKEAARRNVKCFVELSLGSVYKSESSPRKETDKTKPWKRVAKWKLSAEEELQKIEGLNLVILRLAYVYGDYSAKFVGTALSMARVYQHLGKELKFLWSKDTRVNTVHINDVARALWRAADWYAHGKDGWDEASLGKTPLFNIVDHGNTSQGIMSELIAQIFNIPTGFQNSVISSFARLNLDYVVDDVNDETLGPWADLLAAANITRPGPLNPFMEKELLKDAHLSLDGSRFEKVTGFTYEKPRLTKEELEKVIESYKRMNWWP